MNAKFYVPFETAKLLKEKGYPEYTDIYYDANGCLVSDFVKSNYEPPAVFPLTAAPTYHEVLDWLETEKGILVSVGINEVNSYLWEVYSKYRSGALYHSQWVSSREKALNEAIIKSLERL